MTEGLPLDNLPTCRPARGLSMLGDIKVLDLTSSIAGPYATMLLSDFGANVIKVEKPDGDDARHWGPPFLGGEGLWFLAVNRNKQSVVLDLTKDEDRSALMDLAVGADVVVTNQPPTVQQKLGLDYEAFRSVRHDIIFTSITGFGLDGRRRDLTCYDLIAEGFSGIMDVTGAEDSEPQKIGAPAADMLAGQDAAMATIAAIYDHRKTGKGCLVDVSLVESMTRFLTCRISSYLGSGEVPRRSGGKDSVIAVYQTFQTLDHPITLGIGSNAIWKRFWSAVGKPEYADQVGLEGNAERRLQRARIVSDIQEIISKQPRHYWLELFAKTRVPAGPINGIDEVAIDRDLHQSGFIFALEDGERRIPHIGLGIRVDGQPPMPRSAPPGLGADTEAVLNSR